jgi:hypothetical protein
VNYVDFPKPAKTGQVVDPDVVLDFADLENNPIIRNFRQGQYPELLKGGTPSNANNANTEHRAD